MICGEIWETTACLILAKKGGNAMACLGQPWGRYPTCILARSPPSSGADSCLPVIKRYRGRSRRRRRQRWWCLFKAPLGEYEVKITSQQQGKLAAAVAVFSRFPLTQFLIIQRRVFLPVLCWQVQVGKQSVRHRNPFISSKNGDLFSATPSPRLSGDPTPP